METAKECVTTYGPNVLALKIDYIQTVILKLYRSLNRDFVEGCICCVDSYL